jgi:hypothetical protein
VGDMRRVARAALALVVAAIATSALGVSLAQAAALPDGRGYEFVTPGLNSSVFYGPPAHGASLPDGSAVTFDTIDPAEVAENGSVINPIVARRGPAGWSLKSVLSPLTGPVTWFFLNTPVAISPDFTRTINLTEQVLSPGAQEGEKMYYQRSDGTWALVTPKSQLEYAPGSAEWESADFSHLFFNWEAMLPEDPVQYLNSYEWSEAGGLRLVGILPGPGHVPAPNGAALAFPSAMPNPFSRERPTLDPVSANGEEVLWVENGGATLYLREHGTTTVEPAVSQRTVEADPNPPATPRTVGINPAGTEVIFASSSELTNDAFTGRSGGVATDAGSDLYSYDVVTHKLTDLTVDRNPADEATGANVVSVAGASRDADYIYFTATGDLAPGATSGAQNLYVEHDGTIKFISSEPQFSSRGGTESGAVYTTPDGLHFAFLSTGSPTGYNNVNTETNTAEPEVYTYSYGGHVECASCRPSGEPPTGGASFAAQSGKTNQLYPNHAPRVLSDDGSRVFFQSNDAIVPAAKNGLSNVYEYEDGHVYLLSKGGGDWPSTLIDASASGDDVFFVTSDELVPAGQGEAQSMYDARVGAAPSDVSAPAECSGSACLGPAASPPGSAALGSRSVLQTERLSIYGKRRASSIKLKLAVSVPTLGQLSVSGKGLKAVKKKVGEPGVLRVTVALSKSANQSRLKAGAYSTQAKVVFQPPSGAAQRTVVNLQFSSSTMKGGK